MAARRFRLVGNFENAGVQWQPKDEPDLVAVRDFPGGVGGVNYMHPLATTTSPHPGLCLSLRFR